MADLCEPNNKSLREALDAPDGFPVPRHHEYIERVRTVHPHSVVFQEAIEESTCVLYALNLGRDEIYRAIASNFDGRIFAGRAFMEWLINGQLIELDNTKVGCLTLYFNQGVWRHVAVLVGRRRAVSQWGMFPVYEHDLCEVPARYGDELRYFSRPREGEPLRLFLKFAKTQGITDSEIAEVTASSRARR